MINKEDAWHENNNHHHPPPAAAAWRACIGSLFPDVVIMLEGATLALLRYHNSQLQPTKIFIASHEMPTTKFHPSL